MEILPHNFRIGGGKLSPFCFIFAYARLVDIIY